MKLMMRMALRAILFAQFVAVAVQAMDAWHLDDAIPIATEQLDPVLFPNRQASHIHKVFGSSNFRAGYSHEFYENATCSSLALQPDKSAYWMPSLYWYNATADKPYTPLRMRFRFYYRLNRNSPKQYITAFPKGLRTMAGSMAAKVGAFYMYHDCLVEQGKAGQRCQGFKCGRSCPYGFKAVVLFPQCWDGINLWLPNVAHMSYPSNMGDNNPQTGSCPLSHPVRVPQILLEGTFHPEEVAPGVTVDDHLMWSFGDTTGYGWHGDFVNGWDVDLLQRALRTPGTCVDLPNGEISIKDCELFAPHYDVAAMNACKPAARILAEPNGQTDRVPVARLPGCNLPWGTGSKPRCDPPIADLDVSSLTTPMGPDILPESEWQNFKWPTTRGWSSLGCFSSYDTFNSTTAVIYNDPALTGDRCRSSCLAAGYTFAAVQTRGGGSTFQCACANDILRTAPVYPNMCDLACPGGVGTCGGVQAAEVFWAGPNVTFTAQQNATSVATCIPDDRPGLRNSATYSFTSYTMSVDYCLSTCTSKNATWALLRGGQTCYCGTGTSLMGSSFIPNTACTAPCFGNSSQICGGPHASNFYNLTTPVIDGEIPNGAVSNGCYDQVSGLTGYTLNMGSAMTVETCTFSCAEMGFGLAGVTGGTTCNCGNWWTGPSSSSCLTPCKGNSNETCGGTTAQEVYDVSKVRAPARSSGWKGCFADSQSKTLVGSSFTSTTATTHLCAQSCAAQGYALSGVKNGNACYCAASLDTAAVKAPSAMCDFTACAGNSTESCGAPTYLGVYDAAVEAPLSGLSSGSTYSGCYTDGGSNLNSFTQAGSGMTIGACETLCAAKGTKYFGLRQGTACLCGNNAPKMITAESVCSQPCGGNLSEICGASTNTAVSVYNLSNSTTSKTTMVAPSNSTGYVGCYARGPATNQYPLSVFLWSTASMTNELCQSSCAAKGYLYSGTQESRNCYCDNALNSTSFSYPLLEKDCDNRCAGNALQWCGGGSRMSISEIAKSGAAAPVNNIEGYQGCYTNSATFFYESPFTLNGSVMTTELCRRSCKNKGYTYAGLQFGWNCGCTNTMNYGVEAPLLACSSKCTGNNTQTCGGGGTYLSVYDTVGAGAQPPSAYPAGYAGCFPTDSSMTTVALKSSAMTPALCQSTCAAAGKTVASMTNDVCYCGSAMPTTTQTYDHSCNRVCPGNSTFTCGQSGKVSTYLVGNVAPAVPAVVSASTSTTASSAAAAVAASSSAGNSTTTVTTTSASSSALPASPFSASSSASSASSSSSSASSSARPASSSSAAAASAASVSVSSSVSANTPTPSAGTNSTSTTSTPMRRSGRLLRLNGRNIVLSRET